MPETTFEIEQEKIIKLQKDIFELNWEHLRFEALENPPSKRVDICAFILLDQICPPSKGHHFIIRSATPYAAYLDINVIEFADKVTPEQLLYLVRCGLRLDFDKKKLYLEV